MTKTGGKRQTLTFKVTGDASVRADLHRQREVISFVSEDAKVLNVESDYRTLDLASGRVAILSWLRPHDHSSPSR